MTNARKSRNRFTRCLKRRDLLSSRLRAYFLSRSGLKAANNPKKEPTNTNPVPGMLQVRQYRHGCAGHLTHSLAAWCRDWKQTKPKASIAAVLPAISATFRPFFQFGYIDDSESLSANCEAGPNLLCAHTCRMAWTRSLARFLGKQLHSTSQSGPEFCS